jgi:DNA-binding transcriptional LysR family regulator
MDLNKLRVFHEVARTGSFTKAAEALYLAQPSVSIHVRDLERALGVPLFERLGRGVRLTEPGRALAGYATRMFALAADAEAVMAQHRGAEAGSVALGGSSTPGIYLLPALVAGYRRAHRGVRVEIRISDTGGVQAALEDLTVDLGVTGAPISGMDNEPWLPDALVLVAGRGHPWIKSPPRRAQALRGAAFVLREPGSSVRAATEAWLAARGIEVDVVMTLDDPDAVKRAVVAGLGVTIATSHGISSEVRAGDLAVIPCPGLPIRRRLHIVRNPRKPVTPPARALIEFLRSARQRRALVAPPPVSSTG